MGTTIVILGMHRSGTSCVTRMLNHCGLELGTDVLDAASVSNMAGKWEARRAIEINDALLAASGGSWGNPPAEVHADEAALACMREFLATLRPPPISGWKDPRNVLTFPLWKPLLGSYRVVACLRHPLSVAESLAKRHGWPIQRGLELWLAYNERLLRIADGERDIVWFDFDLSRNHVEPWLRAACNRLGLEYRPAALESFNEFHRHHQHVDVPDDPRIRAVYQDLWYRAHQDDVHRSESRLSTHAGAARLGSSSIAKVLGAIGRRTQNLDSRVRRVVAIFRQDGLDFDESLVNTPSTIEFRLRLQDRGLRVVCTSPAALRGQRAVAAWSSRSNRALIESYRGRLNVLARDRNPSCHPHHELLGGEPFLKRRSGVNEDRLYDTSSWLSRFAIAVLGQHACNYAGRVERWRLCALLLTPAVRTCFQSFFDQSASAG